MNPINLLHYGLGRKLPLVLQTEVAECGIAAMAMVANYHGHNVDLNALRNCFCISTKGATLANLMLIADGLDFVARPLRLELEELAQLNTPCILHWDLNHFVVLKKASKNHIVIHDPAVGVRKLSIEEASKHFTGVALELTKTPSFAKQDIAKRAKLSDFWSRITGLKRVLIQIFVLSVVLQIFSIASPFYMQLVVDDVIVSRDENLLILLAIGFGLLMLLRMATSLLRQLIILYMSTQLDIQMMSNLLRHLLRLPMDYFEKRHLGDIMSRFGSLGSIKQLMTTGLVQTFVDGFMSIGLLVMMFIYSPILTLVVLSVVVLYLLLRILFYRPYRNLSEEAIIAGAKEDSNFMEIIRAVQSIKLFGHEAQRLTIWQNYYADSVNVGLKVFKLDILYDILNGLLFGIENILVIYLAANFVMAGDMSVGMLFAFMAYKGQFTGSVSALISKYIEFKMLSLHLERLGDIVLSKPEPKQESNLTLTDISGRLCLKGVSFQYSDNEPLVVDQLNLEVEPSTSIAITGASGCGKTTLMKIMLGPLKPTSGNVYLDGQDIDQIGLSHYRQYIGTVMQDDQLLSGSIRDNICFFDPDFDETKMIEVAQQAAIHDDITKMPMGYHTLIGDMGSSLSGGQKQRLLLARALYKEPTILFLDEATSHLDVGLENSVNEQIKDLNITRIFIAHRPSTIAMADIIYEMRAGKLSKIDL